MSTKEHGALRGIGVAVGEPEGAEVVACHVLEAGGYASGPGVALGLGETVPAEEIVLQAPDGGSVTTLVNATPIRSEEGGSSRWS